MAGSGIGIQPTSVRISARGYSSRYPASTAAIAPDAPMVATALPGSATHCRPSAATPPSR